MEDEMLTKQRVGSLLDLIGKAQAKVDDMTTRERADVKGVLYYVKHSLKMAESYLARAYRMKTKDPEPEAEPSSKCSTCGGKLK
jgi:hypothetical protein